MVETTVTKFLNEDYPDDHTEVRVIVGKDGRLWAFCNDVSAIIKVLMPDEKVYVFEYPDTQVQEVNNMGWEIRWDDAVKEIASQIVDNLNEVGIDIVRENERVIREITEEIVEQMEENLRIDEYEPVDIDEIVECIFWLGGDE